MNKEKIQQFEKWFATEGKGILSPKNEYYRFSSFQELTRDPDTQQTKSDIELPDPNSRPPQMTYEKDWKIPPVFAEDPWVRMNEAYCELTSVGLIQEKIEDQRYFRLPGRMNTEQKNYYFRNQLQIQSGLSARLIDEHAGQKDVDAGPSFACGVTEVQIDRNAQLKYLLIQSWPDVTQYRHRFLFHVAEGARLELCSFFVGGRTGQIRIEVMLEGKKSEFDFYGAAHADLEQNMDLWLSVTHLTPQTKAKMEYLSVLADQSRAAFNSNIKITRDAVQTESYQKHRTLLLSDEARVDTLPRLEIDTDDVQCGHGANVSTLDTDQLYYLQSHGIMRPEAETMIVRSFTAPVLERIPEGLARTRLEERLAVKLAVKPAVKLAEKTGSPHEP